jgi:hypothetical protein
MEHFVGKMASDKKSWRVQINPDLGLKQQTLSVRKADAPTRRAAEQALALKVADMINRKKRRENRALVKARQLSLPYSNPVPTVNSTPTAVSTSSKKPRGISIKLEALKAKLKLSPKAGGYASRASAQEAARNYIRTHTEPTAANRELIREELNKIIDENPAFKVAHPRGLGLGRKDQVLQSATTNHTGKKREKPQSPPVQWAHSVVTVSAPQEDLDRKELLEARRQTIIMWLELLCALLKEDIKNA